MKNCVILIAFSYLCCAQKQTVTPGVLREVYTKISGSSINALKSNTNYPLNPSSYNIIDMTDAPVNSGDYYGQRLRGWFLPPETGSYTFYISCDNFGQLYLSKDSNSLNKVLIIDQTTYTGHNQWKSYQSQASKPVILQQSEKYYIEALMAEMTGSDCLSIGVTSPSKSSVMVVESNMLSPIHIEKCIASTCIIPSYEECIFEKGAYKLCTCVYGQKIIYSMLVCNDGIKTNQDSLYIEDEFPIVRNTYIATLKTLFKEYSVSFDIKPNVFANWQNVLFWSGLLNKTYGFRNTSIFFSPNGYLCMFFALNSSLIISYNTTGVFPLTYWTSLNISQESFNSVYRYSLRVNKTVVYSITNINPMDLSNVEFYAASSFNNAHVGSMRNLIITSGNYSTLSSWTSWSSCNSSCGNGFSNRSRICIKNLGLNCTTKSTLEFSYCFSNISCKDNILKLSTLSTLSTLSSWTSWSTCNSSCGIGLSNRSRICTNNLDLNCATKSAIEFNTCFSYISCKESWLSWSDWSTCNVTWGYGFKNRSRICNSTNKYDCSGFENELSDCFRRNICEVPAKPSLNVSYSSFFEGNLLSIVLKVHQATPINVDVLIEYFLPTFLTFISENESSPQSFLKVDANPNRYIFPGLDLPSLSFAHHLTVMFDDTKCPLPGVFQLEIPMTLIFHDVMGKCWGFTKRLQNSVKCSNSEEENFLKEVQAIEAESYGREIFWDVENSHVFICMNQHAYSDKTACYFSNDDGNLWRDLDIRIGSILGRHSKNKMLYAIHRNRKTYMIFHDSNKMWFALAKEEYEDAALYIDPFWRRSLEGDYDHVYTLGPNQWLGNAEGLFYRREENDHWLLRAKWLR